MKKAHATQALLKNVRSDVNSFPPIEDSGKYVTTNREEKPFTSLYMHVENARAELVY